MTVNLLKDSWRDFDSAELRFILLECIGKPGQYHGRDSNPNTFYLPLADSSWKIKLSFSDSKQIVAIEPGPAFDADQWGQVVEEIERTGPYKIGRDISFSSFRVTGSWRGKRSGVQILPPPADAPQAPMEKIAEHPFILEFPVKVSDLWQITNFRRMREHRQLTYLLNILLAGGTTLQPRRSRHLWATVLEPGTASDEVKWVQEFFFTNFGEAVRDELSSLTAETLEEVEPEIYYTTIGHDGRGLRVPSNLDDSICCYMQLSKLNREKFSRAAFWMHMARRQWNISLSASFASLVSAIESFTGRGDSHQFKCPTCGKTTQHEVPGATRRFKDFFDTYAPGIATAKRRNDMYSLRSGILHGSWLMEMDQGIHFGWAPPEQKEEDLTNELWGLTRIAICNWLKNPIPA
jgi:hypothetical protein